MKEEELKLLENEFCLGCARSCDLLHPNCERGLVKMQEILEEYNKRDDWYDDLPVDSVNN